MANSVLLKLLPGDSGFNSEDGPDGTGAPEVRYGAGESLSEAVYLSGLVEPPALCSGIARCGRCRMRIVRAPDMPPPLPADRAVFSEDELAAGMRLACRHRPQEGMLVELPPKSLARGGPQAPAPLPGRAAARGFLAIDLGTTSMQWRLVTPSGDILRSGGRINPQMGAGSDVMSRLAAAGTAAGRERLSRLTLEALMDAALPAPGESPPEAACLAANTAMSAIALNLDTRRLAAAPYGLPLAGGEWEDVPGLPPLWLPPQISPFVGGDVSAGYAALALDPDAAPVEYPFLLADMGTNGEFLLALAPDRALAGSVPLGPALEGIGLSHGMLAGPLAVSAFSLGPKGLSALTVAAGSGPLSPAPDDLALPGITGAGYISLMRILLQSRAMDRDGRFTPLDSGPLARFFPVSHGEGGEPVLALAGGLALPASDVEEILKVKAAFSLALKRLLANADMAARDLKRIFLAGALGRHVDKAAMEETGFLPPGAAARTQAVGNSSLAGACFLVRSGQGRAALNHWAGQARSLDLASDPAFIRAYAENMRFSW
ncbi:MAG: ASKHA domain-containing protein [Desulfovibrio sp.]|jgi:uncharacterized 2Fe-2S/4Fe-4S cluster protein (DUF4445 family)|nr:ASKHA domain-containing protein [Desulfovibrio sp.]